MQCLCAADFRHSAPFDLPLMICAHEFSGPTAAMASPCTIISLEWRLYSALAAASARRLAAVGDGLGEEEVVASLLLHATGLLQGRLAGAPEERSEEHTSELQSLMRHSHA